MTDFDHEVMQALRAVRKEYAIRKDAGEERPDWEGIIKEVTGSSCIFDATGKSLAQAVREEADSPKGGRRPKENQTPYPIYFGGRSKRSAHRRNR